MGRLIVLLALGLLLLMAVRHRQSLLDWWRSLLAQHSPWRVALGLLAVICVLMALTGRLHWLVAVMTGLFASARSLLSVMLRLLPLLRRLPALTAMLNRYGLDPESPFEQAQVRAEVVRVTLDPRSGELCGEVLEGPMAGRPLTSLSIDECQQLHHYCKRVDNRSVPILEAFLDRHFGEQWRGSPGASNPSGFRWSGAMSHQQALEILGLHEGADRKAVIAAHRRLMQKLHPDRGGNDYLASAVNAAKDRLLAG